MVMRFTLSLGIVRSLPSRRRRWTVVYEQPKASAASRAVRARRGGPEGVGRRTACILSSISADGRDAVNVVPH